MLPHLPWPLPAVLGWSSSWLLFLLLQRGGWTPLWALLAASLWGALISLWGDTLWRKLFIAGGFPLSLALTQAQAFPAWAWLLPLACLLLLYPLQSWKDAPLFPTPPDALNDLPGVAPVEPGAAVLSLGFSLRLVDSLARGAGGRLDIGHNALTLHLPSANSKAEVELEVQQGE